MRWVNGGPRSPEDPTRAALYEPFLGGGMLTALSVPLIISTSSLTFGIASAAVTAGLIIWGMARNGRAGRIRAHRHG